MADTMRGAREGGAAMTGRHPNTPKPTGIERVNEAAKAHGWTPFPSALNMHRFRKAGWTLWVNESVTGVIVNAYLNGGTVREMVGRKGAVDRVLAILADPDGAA